MELCFDKSRLLLWALKKPRTTTIAFARANDLRSSIQSGVSINKIEESAQVWGKNNILPGNEFSRAMFEDVTDLLVRQEKQQFLLWQVALKSQGKMLSHKTAHTTNIEQTHGCNGDWCTARCKNTVVLLVLLEF